MLVFWGPVEIVLSKSLVRLSLVAVLLTGPFQRTVDIACSQDAPNSLETIESRNLYLEVIKPILKQHCYACHGGLAQESGLRLDTGAFILNGSDSGEVVVPNAPEESLLIDRVIAEDEFDRMPPEGPGLTDEQIAAIRFWIADGAYFPDGELAEGNPLDHWSFQFIERPHVPFSRQSNGYSAGSSIDAFINARLSEKGLIPTHPARQEHLLRRVYLDLIGLPPTASQIEAFLDDTRPDAYERVVDRLLADPRYGERWARHWMDVWRYSDWYGRRGVPDVWNSAPQVWRWRDWIVQSLNDDRGYDRMLQEMLAGDEVAAGDYSSTVATGYLIRNWYALNPNDWMRNTVEHTSKAFLGLTLNCAHCHDHKYDPIAQEDYFRFRAFFEPMYVRQDQVAGEADPGLFQDYEYSTLRTIQRLGSVQVFDKFADAPTWFYLNGDERQRQESLGSIPPGVPDFLNNVPLSIEPVDLPRDAWLPKLRTNIRHSSIHEARDRVRNAKATIAELDLQTGEDTFDSEPLTGDSEQSADSVHVSAPKYDSTSTIAVDRSLVVNASEGRRIVQNCLGDVSSFPSGTRIQFRLSILQDNHVNFQLGKHTIEGLTATYVGFVGGRVVAYRPQSFDEFDVGQYEFQNGESVFVVSLILDRPSDQCELTVTSETNQRIIVESQPIALNHWDPSINPAQSVTFDVRPGTIAAIDEVKIFSDPSQFDRPTFNCDFDQAPYRLGRDIVGIDGWFGSTFNASPAHSYVAVNHQSLPESLEAISTESDLAQTAQAFAMRAGQMELASAELAFEREQLLQEIVDSLEESSFEQVANDRSTEWELLSEALSREELASTIAEQDLQFVESIVNHDTVDRVTEAFLQVQSSIDVAAWQHHVELVQLQSSEKQVLISEFGPVYPRTSTGRRTALANWMVDRRNPLTLRVAINHIWLRHLNAPIVSTMDDFGVNGAKPTHPMLLDWLSVELFESEWQMKHVHRLVVTSEAYRRSSQSRPETHQQPTSDTTVDPFYADPENRLLWRMNVGRMESEVVRDSMLHCAQSVDFRMSGQELENSESLTSNRRSLYFSTYPEQGGLSPIGELFDGPDPLACYRRTRSVLPQQALVMTNSDFVHRLSNSIADRVLHETKTHPNETNDFQVIERSFLIVLGRRPSADEAELCSQFLSEAVGQSPEHGASSIGPEHTRKVASMIRALFSHNDFVSIR